MLQIAELIIRFGLAIPLMIFCAYEFYCSFKYKELSTFVFGYVSLILTIFFILSGIALLNV